MPHWRLDSPRPRPQPAPRELARLCPSSRLLLTSLLGLGTGNESFGTITPGPQDRGAPRAEGGPFYSQWLVQVGLGVEGKGGMKAGSQAPQVLETQTSLPVAAQPGLSLSPNFHTSRTSRSMASLKLSAPSRLLVLGFRLALPEGVKGSSLLQGLGGDSGASLRPVSGRLWGSEIPGDRTRTRWTEMSKASSSRRL